MCRSQANSCPPSSSSSPRLPFFKYLPQLSARTQSVVSSLCNGSTLLPLPEFLIPVLCPTPAPVTLPLLPQHALSCSVLDLCYLNPTRFPLLDLHQALIWIQLKPSAPVSQQSQLITKTIHLSLCCVLALTIRLSRFLPIKNSAALRSVCSVWNRNEEILS